MTLIAHTDAALMVLGVSLCFAVCLCVFRLRSRMRHSAGLVRASWIFLAGLEAGVAVWATQCIVLIAHRPGIDVGIDPLLALSGLLASVAGATLALVIGWTATDRTRGLAGSMMLALTIGLNQALVFGAYHLAGRVEWEPSTVWTAMAVNLLGVHGALLATGRARTLERQVAGAALLTVAVISAHFLTLSAMSVTPVSGISMAGLIHPVSLLFVVILLAGMMLTGGVGAAYIHDAQSVVALMRLRRLADAAREGIVIVRAGRINDANVSFCKLAGVEAGDLLGEELFARFLTLETAVAGDECREGWLQPADAALPPIPVEVFLAEEPGAGGGSEHVIVTLHDLREERAAERRIHHLAEHDTLTDLPNRKAMHARLTACVERAKRARERFAVICVNLDGFKDVNDLHGEAAGDAVLAELGQRFSHHLHEPSFVARYGGDEFVLVVFLPEDDTAFGLAQWLQSLQTEIRRPVDWAGTPISPSACMGISLFPDNGTDVDTLLINADTALQRAKASGRQTFCFFEYATDNTVRERRNLARDLRDAIKNQELVVYYQPQGQTQTGILCGFEALVRWRHPDRGLVPPDLFIPIAEEQGLIVELGEWVLREACTAAARWPSDMTIAVNLSPIQLSDARLADRVREILTETGLAAGRLELEVTESALFRNYQGALDTLRQIKAMGVGVAMDDFGTGFSSLSTLQSFPFDKIKIDKSFVQGIGQLERSTVIVRAVLGIGRGLAIPVVAEGVETEAQLAFLRAESCAVIQGYLFGRPAPLADHAALLKIAAESLAAGAPRATAASSRRRAG